MTDAHSYRQKLILLLLDVLMFVTAFVAAMWVRFNANLSIFEFGRPPWEPMINSLPIMFGIWLVTLAGCGLYRLERNRLFFELARLVQALLIVTGILAFVVFFYRGFSYSRGFALVFISFLLVSTFFGRVLFRVVRTRLEQLDRSRNRVLLVGMSPVAEHLASTINAQEHLGMFVVGALDDETPKGHALSADVEILGSTEDLAEVAEAHDVRGIVITNPRMDDGQQMALLDVCLARNLEWMAVPSAYELMLDRVELEAVAGVPILSLRRCNIRGGNRLMKRTFDVVVASLGVLLVSPLMLMVAALIKLTSKGPVFFSQMRIGENAQPFRFYKFRSMHVDNDDSIHRAYTKKLIEEGAAAGKEHDTGDLVYKIQDDPRLIPIGAFIRKYSIDELPQLFNVIRGDMSLIGPRPPVPYEVDVYREWHRRRFEGPPGITGLWQVSGRNRLSFDEMVKLDIEYLENWSFMRDLQILWRTMGVVLFDRAY
ncbi:MAG: sugar transferase [Deltaproteobacteria bacterium]